MSLRSPERPTVKRPTVQQGELAPLGRRGSEMQDLAAHAMRLANPSARLRLTPSVIEALAAQTWPGNLRELGLSRTTLDARMRVLRISTW